jgi:hypothetical protein
MQENSVQSRADTFRVLDGLTAERCRCRRRSSVILISLCDESIYPFYPSNVPCRPHNLARDLESLVSEASILREEGVWLHIFQDT